MDVKTTFLHGELDETTYTKPPDGFIKEGIENQVCLLKRSLHDLKQLPRMWYMRFDEYTIKIGFSRSKYECCVYFKGHGVEKPIYLLLYVDDMLLASQSMEEIARLKEFLNSKFEMKDLKQAKKILGMEIIRKRDRNELYLSQESYIRKVLNRFEMIATKSVATPLA